MKNPKLKYLRSMQMRSNFENEILRKEILRLSKRLNNLAEERFDKLITFKDIIDDIKLELVNYYGNDYDSDLDIDYISRLVKSYDNQSIELLELAKIDKLITIGPDYTMKVSSTDIISIDCLYRYLAVTDSAEFGNYFAPSYPNINPPINGYFYVPIIDIFRYRFVFDEEDICKAMNRITKSNRCITSPISFIS